MYSQKIIQITVYHKSDYDRTNTTNTSTSIVFSDVTFDETEY